MKLGLWLGLALSAAVALPAVGCLGAPFGTGTGGAGGGAGGATTSSSSSSGAGGDSCVPPAQSCDNDCVDILIDTSNCGSCGNHCKTGQQCVNGQCKCPTGQNLCSGACVDKKADPKNCGSCGNVCDGGQTCQGGSCACPMDLPDTCSNTCVNKHDDATNCGSCGNVCPNGGGCNNGSCGACTGMLCNSVCVDTNTSKTNCGSCGHHCGPNAACTAGKCGCDGGKTYCDDTLGCIDTQNDPAHCGGCGSSACAAGDTCTNGVCTCPGGGADCGSGTCAVLAASPHDCGTCGNGCNADQACSNGMCGCRPPQMKTPAGCVDPKHDPDHCSGMNLTCDTDTQVCAGALGCVLISVCNNTGVACDGGCYLQDDFKRNPFHCGDCATACAVDEVCVEGKCTGFTVPPKCDGTTCSGGGSNCCGYPGITGVTICVAGNCPAAP